jgi:hypothetical protein
VGFQDWLSSSEGASQLISVLDRPTETSTSMAQVGVRTIVLIRVASVSGAIDT